MSVKYFDNWEFQQALSFLDTDPFEAKIKFEKYLQKYPKDYCTYAYYASVLITIGQYDEAEKILEYVKKLYTNDENFSKETDKIKHLENDLICNKIRILSYKEKFNDVYDFLLSNSKKLDQNDINHVNFYCRGKLGMLKDNKRTPNSYLFRQITEYQENDFLEHIKKHMTDYSSENKNIFISDFPIKEVITEIKKYIPSSKKLSPGYIENVYIFKYNACGRDNNQLVDYFKVVVFNNTQNFITMFPASKCENLPFIDLNYLIKSNKKESRTEKFYNKYKYIRKNNY